MVERRTLYSGDHYSEVMDPREGDLFMGRDGTLNYYSGYNWQPVIATSPFDPAMNFLHDNYHTLERHLFSMQHRMLTMSDEEHDALASFAKYLMDKDKRSEILEDYDMYRAQERMEGNNA